jgi:alanyl-tRNA synthetase
MPAYLSIGGDMNTINDIRSVFINFFCRHGHESVPSGPLD